MSLSERLRLTWVAEQMLDAELQVIETHANVTIRPPRDQDPSTTGYEEYYAQFPESLRSEASTMAQHYELFYCLESSVREFVIELLETQHGLAWWENVVPEPVRQRADSAMSRETDQGVTPRSDRLIDYTTFGDLGEIMKNNWDVFGTVFNSKKALEKVLTSLNTLRGPIAHCSPLAEDEVLRLRLSLRDWYRLME